LLIGVDVWEGIWERGGGVRRRSADEYGMKSGCGDERRATPLAVASGRGSGKRGVVGGAT